MEVSKNYASNGKANTGVALGATGLGVALLNGMGGLLNLGCNNGCGYRNNGGTYCSDDEFVTRYEAKKDAEIAAQGSKIALLEAEINTNNKIADVFERVSTRIRTLENTVNANTCNQAVTNQQIADNIKFVDSKFEGVYRDIAEGDRATRCYVDCHFVPGKLVMPLDSICPPAEPATTPPAKPAK